MTFKHIDYNGTREAVVEAMNDLAIFVIAEMQDAPDQQIYGLTRDQVARLHASYEILDAGDSTYPTAPDGVGVDRVTQYQPNTPVEIDNNSQERPAGLMPYDYDIVLAPESTDDHDFDSSDIIGSQANLDLISTSVERAIQSGSDIEVQLDDGSSVFLDTHTINAIKNAGKFDYIGSFLSDTSSFGDYLKEIFGPSAGEVHDEAETEFGDEDEDAVSESLTLGDAIKNSLNEALIESLTESLDEAYDRNKKQFGKVTVVNRIRGGKVQMRKKKSGVKGYKIKNGSLVRMSPNEMRNRKRAARIGTRKRKQQMAKILRNRKISMRKRKMRLGA